MTHAAPVEVEAPSTLASDSALIDWLSNHPVTSRWDGVGEEEWSVNGFAAIGRGPDFRSALVALIADDRAKSRGIPNARDRKVEGASTLKGG